MRKRSTLKKVSRELEVRP